jgi:thymidylate synthase
VTQRSGDLALGIPFDIAIWSLMLLYVSRLVNMTPDTIMFTIVDAHIYINHIEGVKEWTKREARSLPLVTLFENVNAYTFPTMEDIKLSDYNPHPAIKFDINFEEKKQ